MTTEGEQQTGRNREIWNAAASGWQRWMPIMSATLDPATEVMLDMAEIGPGSRVLDVAAGEGSQSRLTARRVGPQGYVLSTDIAPNMVAFSRQEAKREGLTNLDTQVMDAQSLDLPDDAFDAAISRLGLMLFPDPVRALREMRRVVRPGGTVAAMVIGVQEHNPYLAVPADIIRRWAKTPPSPPGTPGLFSQAPPETLTETYRRAGFSQVSMLLVPAALRAASASECVALERDAFGALQAMLAPVSPDEQAAAWAETEEALRRYETDEGFVAPAEFIIGVGLADGASC